MSWLKPAPGRISSPFGKRPAGIGSIFHQGTDIAANNGSPCIASDAGTVHFVGLAGGFGGLIRINHDDGHETYYAHLSRLDVGYGQYVTQGQQIGATGGRRGQWGAGTSTGSHCHTEHRIDGKPIDPAPFWAGFAGDITDIITQEEESDMKPYFNVKTKELAVGGAGVWEVIPSAPVPGGNGLQIVRAAFGVEIPMQDPDYNYIRSVCLSGGPVPREPVQLGPVQIGPLEVSLTGTATPAQPVR